MFWTEKRLGDRTQKECNICDDSVKGGISAFNGLGDTYYFCSKCEKIMLKLGYSDLDQIDYDKVMSLREDI